MAKQKSTKATSAAPVKTRVSHTVDAVLYRRFRVAAAQADKSESEMFEWLIEKVLSAVHARGMPDEFNDKPNSAPTGAGQGGPPPMMPSGPSYVQNPVVTAADDEDEEALSAASLMSNLPEPTVGPGMAKRSKLIAESYKTATAPKDAALSSLYGEG